MVNLIVAIVAIAIFCYLFERYSEGYKTRKELINEAQLNELYIKDLKVEISTLQSEKRHIQRGYTASEYKLKESEANRELKAKRINELMSDWSKIYDINVILKEDNKDLHKYKELYLKALKELVTLQKNNEFDNLFILQKYVNYAGYKHLDIKFTKQEKLILKNLESCNKND